MRLRPGWNLDEQYKIIKKSMAPVAVFDNDYDDMYNDLLNPPLLPKIDEGSRFVRNLVVYNDEFRGEQVEVKWLAKIENEIIDSGCFTETIKSGYHFEKKITIKIPDVLEDKKMKLILQNLKNNDQKFFDDTNEFIIVAD